jgi:hypothetical protein
MAAAFTKRPPSLGPVYSNVPHTRLPDRCFFLRDSVQRWRGNGVEDKRSSHTNGAVSLGEQRNVGREGEFDKLNLHKQLPADEQIGQAQKFRDKRRSLISRAKGCRKGR